MKLKIEMQEKALEKPRRKPSKLSAISIHISPWFYLLVIVESVCIGTSDELWQKAAIVFLFCIGCVLCTESEIKYKKLKNINFNPLPNE